MTTYRAAYFVAADSQADLVLTTPEMAHLSDDELLAAGKAEAEREGLTLKDGARIVVGEWSDGEGDATEECAYCGRDVAADEVVPALDDDAAWQGLAAVHAADCEWIATRAHRIEV